MELFITINFFVSKNCIFHRPFNLFHLSLVILLVYKFKLNRELERSNRFNAFWKLHNLLGNMREIQIYFLFVFFERFKSLESLSIIASILHGKKEKLKRILNGEKQSDSEVLLHQLNLNNFTEK